MIRRTSARVGLLTRQLFEDTQVFPILPNGLMFDLMLVDLAGRPQLEQSGPTRLKASGHSLSTTQRAILGNTNGVGSSSGSGIY